MSSPVDEIVLSYENVTFGRLAVITINRPKKYNAMDLDHYLRLNNLMRQVNEDKTVAATLIIGTGKFFSAGADVNAGGRLPLSNIPEEIRAQFVQRFAGNNLEITNTFAKHVHPLIIALNGPVIGLTAALTAFGDFIYSVPSTYLLTPFASLGLAPEGGASLMFPRKMGHTLACRALIASEKLSCDELKACNYITKIFPPDGDFKASVIEHVSSIFEDKNVESMHIAKEFLNASMIDELEKVNSREVFAAIERFSAGIPQKEFAKLASGEKRHKI